MGLDGVELIMAFEEHFGVEITDDEAQALITPALVIDLICTKLDLIDTTVCQTQRAFYHLRRAILNTTRRNRSEVRLDTPLTDLAEGKDIKQWWSALNKELMVSHWPALHRPGWITRTAQALAVLTLASVFILRAGWTRPSMTLELLLSGMAFFAVNMILRIATKSFQNQLPAELKTIRELIPYVTTSTAIAKDREVVAMAVKLIVIEQLGLNESDYTEDADFVKNLGLM